ncbi:MAG: exodeoxyribonuclease VII small subunit [Phycisphaerales bacterium]|nr:exodeoxyribonuclease VII small subunit [Phycisphaerales bacterium]
MTEANPPADGTQTPVADLSFEDAASELESIVDQIESGELTLEASMNRHRRGRALLTHCRSLLDAAQQELEQVALEDLPEGEAEH